jgi:hypothetical protein
MLVSWLVNRRSPGFSILFFVTLLLGFAGGAWILMSIRCPRCSARWFWLAASRGPTGAFSTGAVALTKQCAVCGYPDADTRVQEQS